MNINNTSAFVLVNLGWVPDAYRKAVETCSSCSNFSNHDSSSISNNESNQIHQNENDKKNGFMSRIFDYTSKSKKDYKSSSKNAITSNNDVVECVVRNSEKSGYFTPKNKPEKNEWYWINTKEIANHFFTSTAAYGDIVLVEAVDNFPSRNGINDDDNNNNHKPSARYPSRRRFDTLVTSSSQSVSGGSGNGIGVEVHYGYATIWGTLAIAVAAMARNIK